MSIYSGAVKLSKRLSLWERRLWLVMLAVFICSSALWLAAAFLPQLSPTNKEAANAANRFFIGVSLFQALSLTLIVALPVIRGVFTSNPAETLAVDFLRRAYPALSRDIAALVHRDEVRFNVEYLQIAKRLDDLNLINRMNADCFQSSAHYGGAYKDKQARNRSIFSKNELCFAKVQNDEGETIGLSIVIPLNLEAGQTYKLGRLSDLDISQIHVAAPGEPCQCILLFAIGLKPAFNVRGSAPQHTRHIRQMVRCHVLHAAIVSNMFDRSSVELIAQVEKPSIKKLLRRFGMRNLPESGYDGDPLFAITWDELKSSVPISILD